MSKITSNCDFCGKPIQRHPSQLKRHNFCSRDCMVAFSSKAKNPDGYAELKDHTNIGKHLSQLNRELNPARMTLATREKLRQANLGKGEGKGYAKIHGRHEHRVVAERMLGRPLRKGEVVHHIDGNKRNNSPENLKVFPSQRAHAAWHQQMKKFGGDDI